MAKKKPAIKKGNLFGLLKPYTGLIILLLTLALLSNGLSLVIPKIIQKGIDDFTAGTFNRKQIITWFAAATVVIFILSYLQTIFQIFVSEKVARDMRSTLSSKISQQDYNFVSTNTSAKLLTNITSDTDAVKMFVAQAIVSIISSGVLIIGAAILLLNINLRLGLIVLLMVTKRSSRKLVVSIFNSRLQSLQSLQPFISWLFQSNQCAID